MLANRMYLPDARLEATPEDFDLPYSDVSIRSGGGSLHGWLIEGEGTPWLWSHGNGGNISHRLEHAALLHRRFGMPLLLYDYRGYGRSEGEPTEEGTYADVHAALAKMTGMIGCHESAVISYGQSLGGAVATRMATSVHMMALILESTFTSVGDVVARTFARPVARAFSGTYDTHSRIASVDAPVLFMHGSADDVVPPDMSRRLFVSARAPKTIRVLAGARHDDVHRSETYLTIVGNFLEAL
jgi:fermentation-respiration switch protein FrsA (DUF1100 family)